MRLILPALALAILGGCNSQQPQQQEQSQPTELSAPAKGVDRSHAGKPVPELALANADEEPATLADLQGKPALVNFWAIWCAPCVKELPTLEALAAQPGAPRVIAVSEDSATRATVEAFLGDHRLSSLEVWRDEPMAAGGSLGVQILPTTILVGSDGKEIWRYVGDLDWTGPEAKTLLAEAR